MMEVNVELLSSLEDVFEHIIDVQKDVEKRSKDSFLKINELLKEREIGLDDRFVEALQNQDILSQQINATSEAMEGIVKSLRTYKKSLKEDSGNISENITKLEQNLKRSLQEAKDKKSAFSGHSGEEEVEFF